MCPRTRYFFITAFHFFGWFSNNVPVAFHLRDISLLSFRSRLELTLRWPQVRQPVHAEDRFNQVLRRVHF